MKIINLIENTPGREGCLYEHGLSFYIETKNHKLLVDTGASDAFITNAKLCGVNLAEIDTVVLSHGHYDHGGGLVAFMKENMQAKIYIRENVFEDYYHVKEEEEKYIGLDKLIAESSQIVLVKGNLYIDEELSLYTGVTGRTFWPSGNKELKYKKEGVYFQDNFEHEQYLVITSEDKTIMVSGCAHNGILNILEKYRELYTGEPDVVISGFHMMKKSGYLEEDIAMIKETAEQLKQTGIKFYTGHCTGEEPYWILRECMGEQVQYVHSGDIIM